MNLTPPLFSGSLWLWFWEHRVKVLLTVPFFPASLSLPSTVATFSPMGVFSGTLTDVSDVMSNSGLLSLSSRMVIETCGKR